MCPSYLKYLRIKQQKPLLQNGRIEAAHGRLLHGLQILLRDARNQLLTPRKNPRSSHPHRLGGLDLFRGRPRGWANRTSWARNYCGKQVGVSLGDLPIFPSSERSPPSSSQQSVASIELGWRKDSPEGLRPNLANSSCKEGSVSSGCSCTQCFSSEERSAGHPQNLKIYPQKMALSPLKC